MEFDNTNRWALFKNGFKNKDTDPDKRGFVNIDGVEYTLSGWDRETKKGEQMTSGTVKLKEEKKGYENSDFAKTAQKLDDDIPF